MDKHKLLNIESCRSFNSGKWCPAEYDGHCMLEGGIETTADKVHDNCPLRKSPVLFQLTAEVLMRHG